MSAAWSGAERCGARGAPPNSYARIARPSDHHPSHSRATAVTHATQVVVLLASLAAAPPLSAQRIPRADTSAAAIAACDSVIAAARADTARLAVEASVTRADGGVLPDSIADRILTSVLTQLELPSPLQLPLFAAAPVRMQAFVPAHDSGAAALRSPVLNAVYSFTARRDGRLRDPQVAIVALAPGLDDAVLRALAVADTLGGVGRLPNALVPRSGLELQLWLTAGVPSHGHARPLFTALVGLFPLVDAQPPDTLPTPEYPVEEEDAGWEGRVLLQVAVDRNGAPAPGTVEFLQATSIGFAQAALATLPKIHFSPARVNGCAVWQLVRLPFTFRLPDDGG